MHVTSTAVSSSHHHGVIHRLHTYTPDNATTSTLPFYPNSYISSKLRCVVARNLSREETGLDTNAWHCGGRLAGCTQQGTQYTHFSRIHSSVCNLPSDAHSRHRKDRGIHFLQLYRLSKPWRYRGRAVARIRCVRPPRPTCGSTEKRS